MKKNQKITFGTSFSHLHQRIREARIVRRVLERPSTFSFLLVYHFSSPFIHFSFYAILPSVSLFFFFSFFSFFPFQRVRLIRAVGFYIFRFVSRFVGGSPRASASFTKKGARREARGEERKYAGSCPTCICDTATSIARENYSRNVREWIEHGANIVGVLEPAITGLTARPRLVHGHFRQPSGGPRGPVSEYI